MKKRHRKKRKQFLPPNAVRPEYQWLNRQNEAGGPSNPLAIPFDAGISSMPESTLAQKWIRENCKFASAK